IEKQYELSSFFDVLKDALNAGRALLLFDGLDEIADEDGRSKVVRAIDEVLRGWSSMGNRAIVSSRIVGYGAAPVRSTSAVVTLRDFDEPRIAQFLHGWCVAYERFARGEIPESERDGIEQADQLVAEINSNAGA